MPWKFVDEVEPPKRGQFLVWNGEHVAIARRRRDQFVACSEGVEVRDPWENCVVVRGVTHWQPLPKAPN